MVDGTRDDLSRFEPPSFYKAASPDAKAYSERVQSYSDEVSSYLAKVQGWLKE